MAQYYQYCPSVIATQVDPNDVEEVTELSEFDKHRQTLLADDAEEGWASELRRYLGTMQRNVRKDTDLVVWWQVMFVTLCTHFIHLLEHFRIMRNYSRPSHVLRLTSFPHRHPRFLVSAYFREANRSRRIAVLPWAQCFLKNW